MKCILCLLTTVLVFHLAMSAAPAQAERPAPTALFDTIAKLDAKLFDAFNAHKIDEVMAMFADDVEFYQDNEGVSNYEQTKKDFTNMFASVADMRRDLEEGSLEVYPIKDFGAIQIGRHRFTHTENGREQIGSFRFVHIWHKTAHTWKITRVVSYGH